MNERAADLGLFLATERTDLPRCLKDVVQARNREIADEIGVSALGKHQSSGSLTCGVAAPAASYCTQGQN